MAKKTKEDPSGQRTNRRKTTNALVKRLKKVKRQVMSLLKSIPREVRRQKVITNTSLYYYYPPSYDAMTLLIQAMFDENLGTSTLLMPNDWWYKTEIELPSRQGTLEELMQYNMAVEQARVSGYVFDGMPPRPVAISPVLFSPMYLDGIRDAQVRNYGLIKSLSQSTAEQVLRTVVDGIDAAKTPSEIANDISERFDVSYGKAKRIAATEVNRAFNDAKLRTVQELREESGLDIAVAHTSSLMKTTRKHHAARHDKIYTPEQQRKWWNTGTNLINCHCTTQSILMENGVPIDAPFNKKYKDMRNV